MAGDWIKMRTNLDTDPRVIEIATRLGINELHVVGMLWKLWSWADAHTLDGNAIRVTDVTLDRFTLVTGFAEALRKVGWLEGRDGLLTFPRFAEHNGQTAKNRAETKERVAKHRNAKTVTDVTQKALPEKRREEKSITNKQDAVLGKAINPFPDNAEFAAAASQYIKTRTAKHGPAAESTIEAWWYELVRFPVDEAIAILRLSTSAESKRPITNGDHIQRPRLGRKFDNEKPCISNDELFSKIN